MSRSIEQDKPKNPRGVYERKAGSNVWWIRYHDADRRKHCEKIGTKAQAISMYRKRKTEAWEGKKMPANLRAKSVSFAELAEDALAWSRKHKRSYDADEIRMKTLVGAFATRPAESIASPDLERFLTDTAEENEWAPATVNRFKALLSLVFRIGIENGKTKQNPATGIKHRRENNVRVRYLNQYEPAKTDLAFLKNCRDEESRLRAVIGKNFPFHLPEFEIALHTGMRLGEMYSVEWRDVNFERKLLTVPRSKNGQKRHVPLNSVAIAAFQKLLPNMSTSNFVFLNMDGHEVLKANKHWFSDAIEEAGIKEFTWHCLRHTFASRLVMAGVDIRTVQELMGHAQISVTVRYSHLAPAHLRAAVEKLVSAKETDTRTDTRGKRPVRSLKTNAA